MLYMNQLFQRLMEVEACKQKEREREYVRRSQEHSLTPLVPEARVKWFRVVPDKIAVPIQPLVEAPC
jgi:hypothetical protein